MTDLSPTIIAKSDQLNADDLISGPVTIKIQQVTIGSGQDQPINVRYEGDNGKPWKPCKSMRRVLVHVWGADGAKYVGQSLTLYRDPDVKWAGVPVGGIRISHMTGIDSEISLPLTVTRGSKQAHKIQPLKVAAPAAAKPQKTGGAPISDEDWQMVTLKMDQADTEEALSAVGQEIKAASEKYDQASIDKLGAYYKDRLRTIKSPNENPFS